MPEHFFKVIMYGTYSFMDKHWSKCLYMYMCIHIQNNLKHKYAIFKNNFLHLFPVVFFILKNKTETVSKLSMKIMQ